MAVIRASRPSFRNAHDKVAFAVHAAFISSDYLLTATGNPAFSETALSSTSTGPCTSLSQFSLSLSIYLYLYLYLYVLWLIGCIDEVGIERWNELQDDYAFVYFNPEKGSKKVLVKCLVMNDKLLVAALADGASEPIHLEIKWVILPLFSRLHFLFLFFFFQIGVFLLFFFYYYYYYYFRIGLSG